MNIPSHYQSAFFRALDERRDVDLRVVYFSGASKSRVAEGWEDGHVAEPYETFARADSDPRALVDGVDEWRERIHIISDHFSSELIDWFCKNDVLWCHWSETPGIRLAELLGYRLLLFRLLNPLMLMCKFRTGRRIRNYALGAFGQGRLAHSAFRLMRVPERMIADLYYVPSILHEAEPCAQVVEFSENRKIFMAVGALCRRKGTDVLLKAFAKLNTEDWCLVFCGRDRGDGDYQKLAQRLGVQDRVLFLGAYPAERIAEVYEAADVCVLASRFDGWGVVLNEAASLGLPLIATNNCGADWHQIKSGTNGYRVEAGSVGRLSTAMRAYVKNPDLLEIHGAFSRALYCREFTPERNGKRLVDALSLWSNPGEAPHSPLRIIIQQPALPKYRAPFFREIMNRPGIKVELLYASGDDSLANYPSIDLDAEFIPMRIKTAGSISSMWHSAQLMGARRGACDVLVLSWNVQYLSLVPALIRARINGIRTILWGHGYSKNESAFRKKIRDMVGGMADALLFYDYSTAAKFIQDGWDERKIHVAPNSLDQAVIQQIRKSWIDSPSQLHVFQKRHNLAGRKNIVFIGRIYRENRVDLLIRALPSIRREHPDVQLLIIGNANNEVALELQHLAEGLEVAGLIRWLGAIYDENEIAPYMLSSQLFCYPNNVGLSIMHAMGYGIPVVIGDHISGHNPEVHVLKEGFNGLLFKHLDTDDLALKVATILGDPERLKSMGCAARDTILQSFTIDKMADGFIKAVDAVIED